MGATPPSNVETKPPLEADTVKKRRWIGNGTATFIIALLTVIIFAGYSFAVTFFPTAVTLGKEQQGAILGVMIANFGYAVSYYVGSSLGSANKSIELAASKKE